MGQEPDDLLTDGPVVHDKGMAAGYGEKIRHPLQAGSGHRDLAIVGSGKTGSERPTG